jgi:hypothetical protein
MYIACDNMYSCTGMTISLFITFFRSDLSLVAHHHWVDWAPQESSLCKIQSWMVFHVVNNIWVLIDMLRRPRKYFKVKIPQSFRGKNGYLPNTELPTWTWMLMCMQANDINMEDEKGFDFETTQRYIRTFTNQFDLPILCRNQQKR